MTFHFQQKRILVTRSEPKATEFAEHIHLHGGEAVVAPLIHIECTSNQTIDVEKVEGYEWLIFTSANGVDCFLKALKSGGEMNRIKQVKIAAVGSKTNEALRAFGYEADFIPSVYNAKTMAPEFINERHPKGPVLLVQGRLSGTILNEAFIQADIPFDCIQVYDTVTNVDLKTTIRKIVTTETIDYLTFTSPSTVDAFMEVVADPVPFYDKPVFVIGTTTEKRARERGFQHVLVPEVFTVEGMMKRMHHYLNEERLDEHHDERKF